LIVDEAREQCLLFILDINIRQQCISSCTHFTYSPGNLIPPLHIEFDWKSVELLVFFFSFHLEGLYFVGVQE